MIHRHEVLRSLTYNLENWKAICHGLLQFVFAFSTGVNELVYDALLKDQFGWVNWYLVGKFVKKNFCALELFDQLSKRGSANVHMLSVASLDMHDLEASPKLDGSSSKPMVKEVSSEEEANVSHIEIKITEYHGSDEKCDLSGKSNNDSVESGESASQIRDDGYLLFKNLCKMSMKYSSNEHYDDQILLRRIVLSLELLQVVMDDRGPIWCNNWMFLNAIKQFLCLSLLKISALSVMAIFQPLSASSNEKLLFHRCSKTENMRAHVVQTLNGDLLASTVGKTEVTVHNSVSSLSSPISRYSKRLQGGAAVRSVLQLISSGYWKGTSRANDGCFQLEVKADVVSSS
ncbi:hypothetical protein D8674_019475 [Pyrus ussuriensis x Pyrus communis]|uniref:Mon2/Sec7/BIG1-like HUS domain-containing protein n=1 Tax=Pyrus ussuriensis x Pyrus communis TaxID=2448454 RepID=A0A5N5G7W5_9ROSA|nr:hypothetical protein D8674_019475 [Pyrus ussuriensis x Pyrus communis]